MKTSDFILEGYEDLEISTQIVIRAALARNIDVDILNREAHFLRLTQGEHTEYIKEASKTALDSYITFLIMEDKHVSKLLLSEAGILIPEGEKFTDLDSANNFIKDRTTKPTVIKPNTTNFGIAVQVFQNGASEIIYKNAIQEAFKHDTTILIEDFISGQEYRFLVIGNKCEAVCRRVPANVLGDGKTSIKELVAIKNKDIRRGKGHRTPLEIIEMDSIVLKHLQSQKLTPESIIEKDVNIFIRQNSNISTGGDSIDETDNIHPTYLKIAVNAAKSAKAQICGVDIIIEDPSQEPTEQNGKWGILEINFNPVLYIHEFPYIGKQRNIGDSVLNALGFK